MTSFQAVPFSQAGGRGGGGGGWERIHPKKKKEVKYYAKPTNFEF